MKYLIAVLFLIPVHSLSAGSTSPTQLQSLMQETRKLIEYLKPLVRGKIDSAPTSYGTCSGRLTVQTGTPIPTTDQTAQGTLYFTPFNGSKIALYDGSKWVLLNFTERSLALSVSSGSNYDVFAYSNAGTVTLELSAAWTNDTTRNDALGTVNGILVKNSDNTRRYLGTLRASGANVTEDSVAKRYVWNHCNRTKRLLKVVDATDSWADATTSWRAANNSNTNRVEYVVGQADPLVVASTFASGLGTSGAAVASGVGVDSTTVNSAFLIGSVVPGTVFKFAGAEYQGQPGLGYHYIQWLEDITSAVTWYGDNGSAAWQMGLIGTVEG